MRRDQLEHAIRTACQIIGHPAVIIVGSQAILGSFGEDELPVEATMSVEVDVLPISDKVTDVAAAHRAALSARGVRVTVDETPDKIGAKIRNARLDRVPYMLVLGQREAEEGTVSVRHRDKGDLGAMPFEQFADVVVREIAERHISPMI